MIQRIQSLFLLLASAASFGLFGLPFARSEESGIDIFIDTRYDLSDHIGLSVIFGLAGLLALATIFLFNRRKFQLRFTIMTLGVVLIGLAFTVIFFFQNVPNPGAMQIDPGLGLGLIGLAIVLLLLAYRFIRKDEKLVRSMDRLR